jgi:hypothetical protein
MSAASVADADPGRRHDPVVYEHHKRPEEKWPGEITVVEARPARRHDAMEGQLPVTGGRADCVVGEAEPPGHLRVCGRAGPPDP